MNNKISIACQEGESNEHFAKREEDAQKFFALWTRLSKEKNMMGYLCTVHRNKVEVKNNPEVRREIQEQLDKAVNTISLAYVWALLDEGGFDPWESDWLKKCDWLTDADLLELQAWKHVRNTGAHAPSGRAKGFRKEFDEFMTGTEQGLSGLKQNCTFGENSIELKDGMNYRFFEFASTLVTKALDNSANNNPQ